MLSFIFLVFIGSLLGVISGLTPGIHVNTICLMGLGLFPIIGLDVLEFSIAMVAMSITHTFIDFIPSIFLGIPEEETAFSVLPAHRLLLEGDGLEAVKLTAVGSIIGLSTSILFLIPALKIIPIIYETIRPFVFLIIWLSAVILIIREKERSVKALFIFFCSGWFGMEILNLKALSSSQALFPTFTGLFGVSTIILSLGKHQTIPPQKPYVLLDIDYKMILSGVLGSVGGILVGLLPALSPSQVGVLMSEIYGKSVRRFLISVSAINTSDAVFSMAALYIIGNPRSGVAVMISKIMDIGFYEFLIFVGSMATTGILAYTLHLYLGRKASALFSKINYNLLSVSTIIFIIFLTFLITGLTGILILTIATVTGLLPPLAGVSRTHLMGVLIIPTIFFFTGIG